MNPYPDWAIDLSKVLQDGSWIDQWQQHLEELRIECDFEQIFKSLTQLRQLTNFQTLPQECFAEIALYGDLEHSLWYLHDFCMSCSEQNLSLSAPPNILAGLLRIFDNSAFLSRFLISHSAVVISLIHSDYLFHAKSLKVMRQELFQKIKQCDSCQLEQFASLIRIYKYEEYLRITMRDLNDWDLQPAIWSEITAVNEICIEAALEILWSLEQQVFSQTRCIDDESFPIAILGLGKLGGNELNYSSDVDLIFVYDETLIEPSHWFANEKKRQRFARKLIRFISEYTADGFIARVDMRLRPGDEQIPLFLSLSYICDHYENYGKLWERQALIKAQFLTGNAMIGMAFHKMLEPFVFSKWIDEKDLSEIQEMKKRSEQEHQTAHFNVKYGPGGIREIEFFIQVFQLLYGGRKPVLQTSNTLETIERLQAEQLIKPSDAEILSDAYIYLRRIEHRLQMKEEHQTHLLPSEIPTQLMFARQLGYHERSLTRARRHFLQDLKDKTANVHTKFSTLFEQEYQAIKDALLQSWQGLEYSQQELDDLAEEIALQFCAIFKNYEEPKVIVRMQRLMESINTKIEYYQFLLQTPASLRRLVRIAETSEFLWNYLLNHLSLIEQLDAKEQLHTPEEWRDDIHERLRQTPQMEEKFEVLREFTHEVTFLIGSAELEEFLQYRRARDRLSELAETVLEAACQMAKEALQPNFGLPYGENGQRAELAILGLGKLGGRELNYYSDLDLVFLYSAEGQTDGKMVISNQEYYIKFVQRLISILSTFTRNGYAYKLDTRLRPSGYGGTLVTLADKYWEYHKSSQVWERQALLKARVLNLGSQTQWIEKVKKQTEITAYEMPLPNTLQQDIAYLRFRKEKEQGQNEYDMANLKEGYGGILDIEYLSQYLQLIHGKTCHAVRTTQTLQAIDQLAKHDILPQDVCFTFKKAYRFFQVLEIYTRLSLDSSVNSVRLSELPVLSQRMKGRHELDSTALEETLLKLRQQVRTHYNQYMMVK